MSKVKVCYFKKWDDTKGENVRSSRRAKIETIESMGCNPLLDTCIEVDESEIDGNGFHPKKGEV